MQDQSDKLGQEGQIDKAAVEVYIGQLQEEERMLIVLQKELYESSWHAMLVDLRNRLEGRPYIFKLANRIRDDIFRIEKLQAFEKENNIKLSDYIKPPSDSDSQT